MVCQAFILAGGQGQRLRPYTSILPKPLLPVGENPILEIIIKQLRQQGFTNVLLAVNHLHHLIRTFFGNGSDWEIQVRYTIEDKPLGTCGPLGSVLSEMDDHFIIMNGDVLTSLNLGEFLAQHRDSGAAMTVAAQERDFPVDYGVLEARADNAITSIIEKPRIRKLVNLGIYAVTRDAVAQYIAPDERKDMTDLLQNLIDATADVRVARSDCLWHDIGRLADHKLAGEHFEANRSLFLKS